MLWERARHKNQLSQAGLESTLPQTRVPEATARRAELPTMPQALCPSSPPAGRPPLPSRPSPVTSACLFAEPGLPMRCFYELYCSSW